MRNSVFFFLKESTQAYLGNIAGSVPNPHNKMNIKINKVKWKFWFPSACKCCIYTTL